MPFDLDKSIYLVFPSPWLVDVWSDIKGAKDNATTNGKENRWLTNGTLVTMHKTFGTSELSHISGDLMRKWGTKQSIII